MDGYKRYDTSEGYGHRRQWKGAFNFRMTGEEAERIMNEQRETPFSILGVTERATKEQIKAAFRTLITKWHPDKNPDNMEEATEMSKKIIAAYTMLTSRRG